MQDVPVLERKLTLLTTQEGGRRSAVPDSEQHRPHIVIGSRDRREAIYAEASGTGIEHYVGIQLLGNGDRLELGGTHRVRCRLPYHAKVDDSAAMPGATFTMREGGHVIRHGVVLTRRDPAA